MSGHESWGSNKVVCFVRCMLLNVCDDDDEDEDDEDDEDDDDNDDDDDDDDDAIACRESKGCAHPFTLAPTCWLHLGSRLH